jgi:hypothetical protein
LKALLMFRGGVRSVSKTLADGQEHELFYRARTPNELAAHFGAENVLKDDAAGAVERQKMRARFIASSMCDEKGDPLMTVKEAEDIPGGLKAELLALIVAGSNEIGEAGKD